MTCVYEPVRFIEQVYCPTDVDQEFYDRVVEIYKEICKIKNSTPLISEVEEVIFRQIMKKIKNHTDEKYKYDQKYLMDAYYREEVVEETIWEFADLYKDKIVLDIKKSLRHAKVSYVDYDFESDRGNERVVRNTAQVKVFITYDKNGMSNI